MFQLPPHLAPEKTSNKPIHLNQSGLESIGLCTKIRSALPTLSSLSGTIDSISIDQQGDSHKQTVMDNQKIVIRPGIVYLNRDQSLRDDKHDGPCQKYNDLLEAVNGIDRLPCNTATVYLDKPKSINRTYSRHKNSSTRQYMEMLEYQTQQTERSLLSPAILNMNIKVDGSIAAGKSTLGKHLKEYCDWLSIDMILVSENDIINQNLLTSFLQDKCKYAFIFQLHVLMGRVYEQVQAYHKKLVQFTQQDKPCILFFDRTSLTGDMAFAMNNYVGGNISKEQINNYYVPLATFLNKHLSMVCQTTIAHNYIAFMSWLREQIASLMSVYQSHKQLDYEVFIRQVEQCALGVLTRLRNRVLPHPTSSVDLCFKSGDVGADVRSVTHPFHPLNYLNQYDLNVLLTTRVDECQKRIALRGNKAEIDGYSDEYLDLLDLIHKYIYSSSLRSNQIVTERLHQGNLQKLSAVDNDLGVFDHLLKAYKCVPDDQIEIVGVKTQVAYATLEWEAPLKRCMDALKTEEEAKKHQENPSCALESDDDQEYPNYILKSDDNRQPNLNKYKETIVGQQSTLEEKQKQKKKITISPPVKNLMHFFFNAIQISMVDGVVSISEN